MPDIKWSTFVNIGGGPQVPVSGTITVEAYDDISVVVDKSGGTKDVEVWPGGTGPLKFLMISSSVYDDGSGKLVYKAGGPTIKLDGAQIFTGVGAVSALSLPSKITLTNNLPNPAAIRVVVGRDVTP